jgi:hypothetical protein
MGFVVDKAAWMQDFFEYCIFLWQSFVPPIAPQSSPSRVGALVQ